MFNQSLSMAKASFRALNINFQVLLLSLFLGMVCFLVLAPLIWTIISSFVVSKPWEPMVYGLGGWKEAFNSPGILKSIYNTFSLAIIRQFVALILGILLAWVLSRTDVPLKGWMEFMFWLSFFMPALPITMGWVLAFDPKVGLVNLWLAKLPLVNGPVFNIYSFWGIVWAHLTATTLGVKVMLLTPAFRNMDAAMEEAARTAGASMWTTLRSIVIPLMAPAILVTTILGLIRALEAFEIELILGFRVGIDVYSTRIHSMIEHDPMGGIAPASALSSFFLVILLGLVALNRIYIGKRQYTTLTGKYSNRITPLGRWKYPIFALILLIVSMITVIPIAFLLLGTFMTVFGFFDLPQVWTLEHWTAVLQDNTFLNSLFNTFLIGLGAAVCGVIFYSFIAYLIVKRQFVGKSLLDFVSWLPWSIPGILLGFGLLWTSLNTPFLKALHGTTYLLILAIVVKSMPFGIQFMKTSMLQLSDELEEAARMCGGSWFSTYRRILFPLTLPMLIVVGLLVFNSAARDISTLVLLGTADTRTLSLLMLDWITGGGSPEKAMAIGMVIVILVVFASLLARMLGGRLIVKSGE
ncbi:MAG: ABC transporter permease subunit [Deltaproteobacteria bacterium]|nr:ABC transporter permease subunit [Deltaproteobacteria bacterium]